MEDELFRYADLETRLVAAAHAIGVILLAFALGALILPVIAIVPLNLLIEVRTPGGDLTPITLTVLSILQFTGFGIVAIGYVLRRKVTLFEIDLPSLSDIGWIVGGFVALFLANALLSVLITYLGIASAENTVVTTGNENPEFFLYMIPVALLFVGPGEELIFRGVVQGLLRKAYGVVPAIVLSSALFGVAHYLALSGEGKITYIAVAAVLGLVLGTVYEQSKNLLVPTVIHGLWNTMLFLVSWYAATHDLPEAAMVLLP